MKWADGSDTVGSGREIVPDVGTEIRTVQNGRNRPLKFLYHPSFLDPKQTELLKQKSDTSVARDDDVIRDVSRKMHYAAFCWSQNPKTRRDSSSWQSQYYSNRDAIILGNLPLAISAATRRTSPQNRADAIGEGSLNLINATQLYNPWRSEKFSSYVMTSIFRALVNVFRNRLCDASPMGDADMTVPYQDADPATLEEDFLAFLEVHGMKNLLTAQERAFIMAKYWREPERKVKNVELVHALGVNRNLIGQVLDSALGKMRDHLTSN